MTPFETALGARFHHLMPQVRQLHGGRASAWSGQVSVHSKPGVLGQLARKIAGFPADLHNAPFSIQVNAIGSGREEWVRDFDGHVLRSVLWAADTSGNIQESMGPVELTLRPTVKVDTLQVNVDMVRLFGKFALPRSLCFQSNVMIWQDEAGRYRFDIGASLRPLGQFVRYQGWLRPAVQSGFAGTASNQ